MKDHFNALYLAGTIVARDELEVMGLADGGSLLLRQENVGSPLRTLCTSSCMPMDLGYMVSQDMIS